MTTQDKIIKRLPIILLTSLVFGLIIIVPVFYNGNGTIDLLLLILFMNVSFSISSWLLNITFSTAFIQSLNSLWWKWLASTLCLILLMTLLHPMTKEMFAIPIQNLWLFRALGLTFLNSIYFVINILIDTLETKIQLESENKQLRINRLEKELAQLKNQLNPHFLFNALSSLKSLMKRNPEVAECYLMKLSEFLRASIQQKNDLVSLQEELYFCQDYVDLQKIRFQEALIYQTEIDPNALNYCIPFFALQSLEENSLKHNVVSLMHPLTVRVEVKGNKLTIINNVQTLLPWEPSSKTGLQNLDERMKIQTGQPIVIDKNQHYFKVQLTLLSE